MEGISKYSRLRNTAVAAFVAAGLVLMAMSASASAVGIKNISLGIRNSSLTPIRVHICRNGDARDPATTSNPNPCHQITETHVVGSGHRLIVRNSNPVGVIITRDCVLGYDPCPDDRELYFYALNGGVFLPSFFTNNRHIYLSEHQHVLGSQEMIQYELRRYADEDRDGENVKLMRIEIQKWATKTSCQPKPGLPAGGC